MENKINFADIIKILIGEEKYLEFLTQVAKQNKDNEISLESFFEDVFNKYCFIILMIGMSKKVEIEKYKLNTSSNIIEITSSEISSKYSEYIKIVENKKFEFVKSII